MNYGNDPLSRATGLGSRFVFYFPILSCLVSWWGLESVNEENMRKLMSKNANLSLIPGGFEELALTTKKAFQGLYQKTQRFHKNGTSGMVTKSLQSCASARIISSTQ
jgi:hypothetical protein